MRQRIVEFWFDVGSPYSYLAAKALPTVAQAAGATIDWRPMLLGGVFKATGNQSPMTVPAKARWTSHDLERQAARIGVPFRHNAHFPVNTLVLMRGAAGYAMRGEAALSRYLDAVWRAMWVEGRDLGDSAQVASVLADAGIDIADFEALVADPHVKDKLKRDTEEAVARGVFGAPSFFVDGELFWGQDRIEAVAAALDGYPA